MAVLGVGLAGCSRAGPTGVRVTDTIEFGYFTAVSIVGRWDVELDFGEAVAAEVEGDSGILAQLSARVEEQTLHLALRGGSSEDPARARISLTAGTGLRFDGPIEAVTAGTLRTADVDILLLGSANLRIEDLDAGRVVVHVAGQSSLSARGKAESVTVVADGDSVAYLDELDIGTLSLELHDGSVILARVSTSVDGTASGGSAVYVTGVVTSVNVSRTGGSCVIRVDEIGSELRQMVGAGPPC